MRNARRGKRIDNLRPLHSASIHEERKFTLIDLDCNYASHMLRLSVMDLDFDAISTTMTMGGDEGMGGSIGNDFPRIISCSEFEHSGVFTCVI